MRIVSRQLAAGDSSRVVLVLDDLQSLEVSLRTWSDEGLKIGQELSSEQWDRLQRASVFDSALSKSLSFLQHKPRTSQEVERYLKRKGFESAVVPSVVQLLQEKGLVDDTAYAVAYVNTGSASKSSRELEFRLKGKGIELRSAVDSDTLKELERAEQMAAASVAQKYCRSHNIEDPRALQLKLGAYLQRRGFRMSSIRYAIERVTDGGPMDDELGFDED